MADDRPPTATPVVPLFQPLASGRRLWQRWLTVNGQLLGLLAGGAIAYLRSLPPEQQRGHRLLNIAATLAERRLDPALAHLPFAAQLRRRLERLGPTYIKLGQIMAVREDLLPRPVTDELKNLFDQAPAVAFPILRGLIEAELGRPLTELFSAVQEQPLGSASLAQVHRATTHAGQAVVIKVLKPGVRETVLADLKLLRGLGAVLNWLLPHYQPVAIIEEFRSYTVRELDLTTEADNGEIFTACFHATPAIVFPRMYRELSSVSVLTMEFLDGFKPGAPATFDLSALDRAQVVNLGAQAILRMLYQYGFFHADLHAGNLLILPGPSVRIGFVDLGMVGRFEDETRRRLLYYYHALVSGDVEKAAQHLGGMARVGPGGHPDEFRRAVVELSRRFLLRAHRGDFSIARLILESMQLGGRYRIYFRVELVLMVKALVTFEGVGRMVDPELDVVALSRTHIVAIFRAQFKVGRLTRELWRNGPELLDFVSRLPEWLAQSARLLERPAPATVNPLAGLRSAIVAAACLVGGVLILAQTDAWLTGNGLLLVAVWLYRRGAG
ncbi:MAG: AarF/ABC1/UbiB kinase family protein [Candidatus Contendobacter sp.]|jgi:ubiquinone biosynthesis protein|nr:AarF/ABC1/UbiB kinase family protein [Candidatus Contendobacter sp.]